MKPLGRIALLTFLMIVTKTALAVSTCNDAGLKGALYGLCTAYITDGNNCLADENHDKPNCASIWQNFYRISGGTDLDVLLNSGSNSEIIGGIGGTVTLPEIATVTFHPGAFVTDTTVSITTSSSLDINEAFNEFASIFRPMDRLGYEVRIITGDVPPLSEFVHVELVIPAGFAATVPAGYRVEAFAIVEQGSGEEVPFPIFELIPSSYDEITQTVSFDLPGAAFYYGALSENRYEAIITLAPTPGIGASLTTPLTGAKITTLAATSTAGACLASSIKCPVAGGCSVTSPFSPARENPITGQTQPHSGVDYAAANGDSIVAASDGTIERSYSSSSYGETIIVRHTNGSATLYAHLQSRGVAMGDAINAGQQIGTADSTGRSSGPHLHFEYVPNGQIIQSKNRIDPDPCIDALASGSITVKDSGSLADDAFQLSLDGIIIGSTSIGASNTIAINNIIPGPHTLALLVLIAPDNLGTYTVSLSDGITYTDGSTSQSGAPPQGATVTWGINVPIPTTP